MPCHREQNQCHRNNEDAEAMFPAHVLKECEDKCLGLGQALTRELWLCVKRGPD